MLIFIGLVSSKVALAGSVNVYLNVASCNLNTVCEPMIGETTATCAADCPPPPVVPSGSGSTNNTSTATTTPFTTADFLVDEIEVVPSEDHAVIVFKTKFASHMTLSWGNKGEYEIGSLAESWYHEQFNIRVENLLPSTHYYYYLTLTDTLSRVFHFEGDFVTTASIDNDAPPPPSEFRYALAPDFTLLRWTNPKNLDFSKVKLVRSDISFPKDQFSGKIIYEGAGENVSDLDVREGVTYYYSLFSSDKSGNFSGPAILQLTYKKPKNTTTNIATTSVPAKPKDPLLVDGKPYIFTANSDGEILTGTINKNIGRPNICSITDNLFTNKNDLGYPQTTPNTLNLDASNIRFLQNKKTVYRNGSNIQLDSSYPMTLEIPFDKNPRFDGSTLVLCVDGNIFNERFGYLLNKDDSERKFGVVVPAFAYQGDYKFYVKMLELGGQEAVIATGLFSMKSVDNKGEVVDKGFVSKLKSFASTIVPPVAKLALVLITLWFLLFLIRFVFL